MVTIPAERLKRVLLFIGTRPEGIKMAPLVRALRESSRLEPVVCATAQHRALLDQVLSFFSITPEYDLDLMQPNQDLSLLTANAIAKVKHVLAEVKPSLVLVQGDTATTFSAALAAFHSRIPVGHVEAGLRTWDIDSPFPEEGYRQMVTRLAALHFAPTTLAAENLKTDRVNPETIFVTGNTGIDGLIWASAQTNSYPHLERLFLGKKMILMTSHRRENFGAPLAEIFRTVKKFAEDHPEFQIVYPVHPNPNVQGPADLVLGSVPNVSLITPVDYTELVFLLRSCHCVLTDSGGLQEEAPTFGKPVLVLRDSTERPEAVQAGTAVLVGSDGARISAWLERLSTESSPFYQSMARQKNPFGDGTASSRITSLVERYLFPEPVNVVESPLVWDRTIMPAYGSREASL